MEMTLLAGDGADDGELAGERAFGPYTLLHEVGRGGMGAVWKAWDPRLRRQVALKLLLGGAFAGPDFARRFRGEAELAARLHHPGLVAIHEAGEAERQMYYTMEFIDGRSLSEVVRDHALPAETAAQWLRAVAEAVAHAHAQGVLHRDLKPSNILIDERGQPRVTDFGLARLRDALPELTRSAETAGSPPYMAPEQISPRGERPDVRLDVYSLGAVLYHLLTGRPPFQGETVAQVLAQVTASPPVPPRRLLPSLPHDLETICLKCLEKDPRRRYASASDLADDLARFLEGRPVAARPVSLLGKTWRWARRKPALAALAAALVASWVAGTVLVLRQARANRLVAEHLADERYALDLSVAARSFFGNDPELAPGDLVETRRALEAARPRPGERDRRGFEWRWLWQASRSLAERRLEGHTGYVAVAAASPDGRWLVTSGFDDQTLLWEIDAEPPAPRVLAEAFSESLAFSPDSGSIFLLGKESPEAELSVQRRDVATGALQETLFPARQFALAADGRRMLTFGVPGLFFSRGEMGPPTVWDLATRAPVKTVKTADIAPARTGTLSADGRWLATGDQVGTVHWWDLDTGREVARWEADEDTAGPVHRLAFAPDGHRLAAAGPMAARVWTLPPNTAAEASAAPPTTVLDHPAAHDVLGVFFSDDGEKLVTTSTDQAVRLWSGLDQAQPEAALLRGHGDEVWCGAWRRGARGFFTAGKDITVLGWPEEPPPPAVSFPHTAWQPPIFSADSRWLLTQEGHDQEARPVLREVTGQRGREFPAGRIPVQYGRGDSVWLLHHESRHLERWTPEGETPAQSLALPRLHDVTWSYQVRVHPEERDVSLLTNQGEWVRYNIATAKETARWQVTGATPGMIRAVAWNAGMSQVAVGASVSPYVVWLGDAKTGQVTPLAGHRDEITGLAFSPDGQWLASSSVDHDIRVWSVPDRRCERVLAGHPRTSEGVCFSPEDGRTLATIGAHQSVKFWHTGTWRELASLSLASAGSHLSFSPDGRHLAVALHQHGLNVRGPTTGLLLLPAPDPANAP